MSIITHTKTKSKVLKTSIGMLFLSEKNVLRTIFIIMSFLKNDCDVMLKSVFMFKTAAVDMVHVSFELYVSSGD